MWIAADRLALVTTRLGEAIGLLHQIAGAIGPVEPVTPVLRQVERAAGEARTLGGQLVRAIDSYTRADRAAAAVIDHTVRTLAPLAAAVSVPIGLAGAVVGGVGYLGVSAIGALGDLRMPSGEMGSWVAPITNRVGLFIGQVWDALGRAVLPLTGLIPGVVDAADDAVLGPLGARPFGGLAARDSARAALVALSLARAVGVIAKADTRLRLLPQALPEAAAPTSLREAALRIPTQPGYPIRVERYGDDNDRRFIAYLAGTEDASLADRGSPFDLESNLSLVAGRAGQSESAVRQALAAAGHRPGDPIALIGHSQGGLIAAELASDPVFGVVQAITLGAPLGAANERAPLFALERADDPIVGLAGRAEPPASRVTVRYPAKPAASLIEPHLLAGYLRIADRVDASTDENQRAAVARFRALGLPGPQPTGSARLARVTIWRTAPGR